MPISVLIFQNILKLKIYTLKIAHIKASRLPISIDLKKNSKKPFQ